MISTYLEEFVAFVYEQTHLEMLPKLWTILLSK